MYTITSKDGKKEITYYYCGGKCRAYTYIQPENGYRIRKQTARISAITYDKENDVILLRDGLKVSYRNLKEEFKGDLLLDKNYYPREDEADYLGSVFFYMDMEGNIISHAYADATDSFYEIDPSIPFNDEEYAEWKDNLIQKIIEDLKNRSIKRQKQLLKESKYENTKC